tara:strand:- start:535 stop:747 length:213 start_codon:yes stop_codon:yes gene_type:complete
MKVLISAIGVDSALWEAMLDEGVLKTVEPKSLNEIIQEEKAYKITNPCLVQDPALIQRVHYPEPRSKFHK